MSSKHTVLLPIYVCTLDRNLVGALSMYNSAAAHFLRGDFGPSLVDDATADLLYVIYVVIRSLHLVATYPLRTLDWIRAMIFMDICFMKQKKSTT